MERSDQKTCKVTNEKPSSAAPRRAFEPLFFFLPCARTAVGGSVGRWQVGTSLPGLGLEALLAALAVLASGVVLTLALEVPVLQQALGGMEVTLAPERRRRRRREGAS